MKNTDIVELEHRLGVVLPKLYKEALLSPFVQALKPDPYFFTEPKEILIQSLRWRWGIADRANHIVVGETPSQCLYFLSSSDAGNQVQCYEYMSGEAEKAGDLLRHFANLRFMFRFHDSFAETDEGTEQEDATKSEPKRYYLCRTKILRESVLEPITLEQWESFVEKSPKLQMRGYRTMINPFTQEEIREDLPGVAALKLGNEVIELIPSYGHIRAGSNSKAIKLLEEIARDLNVYLLQE